MIRKREDVARLIRSEVGALPAHGGVREQGDNITLPHTRGTNSTYTLRRLKRDRPELAERRRPGRADGYWAGAEALREVARDFLRALEASGYRVRLVDQ